MLCVHFHVNELLFVCVAKLTDGRYVALQLGLAVVAVTLGSFPIFVRCQFAQMISFFLNSSICLIVFSCHENHALTLFMFL